MSTRPQQQRGGGGGGRGRGGGRGGGGRGGGRGTGREDKRFRAAPTGDADKVKKEADENYDSSADEKDKKENEENEEEEEEEEEEEGAAAWGGPKTVYFSDAQLGISEFMHPAGFGLEGGKLKVLPQDFQVNEVDVTGQVVELKQPFTVSEEAAPAAAPAVAAPAAAPDSAAAPPPAKKVKVDLLVADRMDALRAKLADKLTEVDYDLIAAYLVVDAPPAALVLPTAVTNKQTRGLIHQAIRDHLTPLVTSTTNAESKISIEKATSELLRQDMRRSRNANNPAGAAAAAASGKRSAQRHVSFVVRKTNVDGAHCLTELARRSRLPRKCFQISGTKDKRAVTTQIVSVRETSMRSVQDFTNRLSGGPLPCGNHGGSIEVGDLQLVNGERQFLGNLQGNRFTLAVREVRVREELPNVDLSGWQFINYYGTQRFGTGSIGTHEVGVALLNRDYAKTIDMLLQPRAGEDDKLTALRQEYKQGDKSAQELYQALPSRCTAERALAQALANSQFGWNALELVPRNGLTMYLHAVQSLIWNKMANLRLGQSRTQVVAGDLVSVDDAVQRVKTAEEASKYTLAQVVLPLPGGVQTLYPETASVGKEQYDALAKQMGVTNGLAQFNASTPRPLMLTGGYRALIAVPKNVKFEMVRYSGRADHPLLGAGAEFLTPTVIEEGDVDALLVQFTLGSGSYATMAIRELLHQQEASEDAATAATAMSS